MKFRLVIAGVLLVPVVSACYTQVPLETASPPPETRVIARVTDSGAVAIGAKVGPGATEVEGVVASANQHEWTLNLLRVDYRGGISTVWNREPVIFPRYALSHLMEKRVNKQRSWMAAGLFVVGAFAVTRLFGHGGSDEEEPPIINPEVIWSPAGGVPGGR
ncbi:MAG: hypothetical protein ACSLFK_12685 [Gemmatimonadaceae bacterium]